MLIIINMSTKVEQKIKGNIYVYEVHSYWDKKSKKAKQKKIYLGKKDKLTGKVEKKSKVIPRLAKDFGCIYFFIEIIKKIGIDNLLKKHFAEIYNSIINLLVFKLSERKPLYLFETWMDNAETDMCVELSSARISDVMISLGKDEIHREQFFKNWTSHNLTNDNLFYDITSFSTYSETNDLFEWGHNRDNESLPQINLGIIMAYPSGMPLFYEVYPGSITDVVTIINILKRLKFYELKNFTLILDKGFYSESNILKIYKMCDFIIPMPFSTKISRKLLDKTASSLDAHLISKVVNLDSGRTVFCDTKSFKVKNKKFYAHIFVDNEKKTRIMNNFFQILGECEKKFNESKISKGKDIIVFFEIKRYKEYKDCFKIIKKGRIYQLIKNEEYNSKDLIVKMGKTILITKDQNIKSSEIIDKYYRRDFVEKAFDDLKNELNEKKLRASNKDSLQGRLFFNFISLIIQSYCLSVIRKNEFIKSFSVEEIINELKKIRCVNMLDGSKYLTEITKTQKEIFKAFKIELPGKHVNKNSAL